MSVLGALFGGVGLATRGGGQPKPATPPIQASSKDEETFIQYVSPLRQMDISAIKYYARSGWGAGTQANVSHRDFLKQVNGDEKKKDH